MKAPVLGAAILTMSVPAFAQDGAANGAYAEPKRVVTELTAEQLDRVVAGAVQFNPFEYRLDPNMTWRETSSSLLTHEAIHVLQSGG